MNEASPEIGYSTWSDERLLDLLSTEEDRLTRAAVDEFISRGGRMIVPLTRILESKDSWLSAKGRYWSAVHATKILAAIGGEAAIPGLLAAVHFANENEDWIDVLLEDLPHMFASIDPPAVAPLLARAAASRSHEKTDFLRALACIAKRFPDRREEILEGLRAVAADEREPLLTRAAVGAELLDFARPQDRELLLELGRLQEEANDSPGIFYRDTVRKDYETGPQLKSPPPLEWLTDYDPGTFQEELPEEYEEDDLDPADEELLAGIDDPAGSTFVGPAKVGRNDPCPCGSGMKFKKCCET